MLDIAPTELLLVALVALIVIGPKDLPRVMRVVGRWVGRARGVARQFRSGFDEMVRQAELEEMEKKWAAENERIMREHPPHDAAQAEWRPPHDDGRSRDPEGDEGERGVIDPGAAMPPHPPAVDSPGPGRDARRDAATGAGPAGPQPGVQRSDTIRPGA